MLGRLCGGAARAAAMPRVFPAVLPRGRRRGRGVVCHGPCQLLHPSQRSGGVAEMSGSLLTANGRLFAGGYGDFWRHFCQAQGPQAEQKSCRWCWTLVPGAARKTAT